MADKTERFLWHYVVTRSDMPPDVQVVQLAHAVGESVLAEQAPLRKDTRLCWLHAESESQLREYRDEVARRGIPHAAVVETDGPHAGQLTALALAPTLRRSKMRKLLHHLPLARLGVGTGEHR